MPLLTRIREQDRLRGGERIITCRFYWSAGKVPGGAFFVGTHKAPFKTSASVTGRSLARVATEHKFVWDLCSDRCKPSTPSPGTQTPTQCTGRDEAIFGSQLIWRVHVTPTEWEDPYTMRQICQKLVPYCQEVVVDYYYLYNLLSRD